MISVSARKCKCNVCQLVLLTWSFHCRIPLPDIDIPQRVSSSNIPDDEVVHLGNEGMYEVICFTIGIGNAEKVVM